MRQDPYALPNDHPRRVFDLTANGGRVGDRLQHFLKLYQARTGHNGPALAALAKLSSGCLSQIMCNRVSRVTQRTLRSLATAMGCDVAFIRDTIHGDAPMGKLCPIAYALTGTRMPLGDGVGEKLSTIIKGYRHAMGITQQAMADAMDVDNGVVRSLEDEHQGYVTIKVLSGLADVLETSTNDLVRRLHYMQSVSKADVEN